MLIRNISLLILMALSLNNIAARELKVSLVETTDMHGNFFPRDFINARPAAGSLARVSTLVDSLRESGRNIVLLDNGDILQGQPTAYYYNFIDTVTPHPVARMLNFLGYDAASIGNHDVETGHAVYDRYRDALGGIPLLGANVIDTVTGQPYLQPYAIIERDGVKIAVLGLLTPSIPAWLPENLWSGLRFDDIVESASRWIPIIREKEHPHIIAGLFHSGKDSSVITGGVMENASLEVARLVPGFDVIFFGHDHNQFADVVENVAVLNPGAHAGAVAMADIALTIDNEGNILKKEVVPHIISVAESEPDSLFMHEFEDEINAVTEFVDRQVAVSTDTLSLRDAYFGPSSFMTLIHDLQLAISGADVSFAAPLTMDATIAAGPVKVNDMFKLYRYENLLYTMRLSGREIKDYLEESYDKWIETMTEADDHLLKFATDGNATKGDFARLKNPSYNFDSAAGIIYTVDVTQPAGNRVTVISMADGSPFDPEADYKVAINSYRANGGGDLLTRGAGIPLQELKNRILSATDKDLRYYLMKEIERRGTIDARVDSNWRFIPEHLTAPASLRDRKILFGD
ncbi:MAG: 5'-nucleotidase C-terminal domain-containing protein [Duncaniella sp.]|nr:5'-nucleotidase C-terminal domain-containing protein [Duncaniella sp.]